MTLEEAQHRIDDWIKTYGVRYFSELTNLAVLMEEVGELARLLARSHGDQSFKNSDEGRNLGDEMADVLFVLLCLANQTGVDLTAALERNLEKKRGAMPIDTGKTLSFSPVVKPGFPIYDIFLPR